MSLINETNIINSEKMTARKPAFGIFFKKIAQTRGNIFGVLVINTYSNKIQFVFRKKWVMPM